MADDFVQAPPRSRAAKANETLRQLGHTFPEAHEDYPWGHLALRCAGRCSSSSVPVPTDSA